MGSRKQAFGGALTRSDEPLFPSVIRSGDLLFLSGQAPVDPLTSMVCATTFPDQAAFVLQAIADTLALAGGSMADVLRVECILANAHDFEAWNELYASAFPTPRPVRTTLVGQFVLPGMLLEVQATACF